VAGAWNWPLTSI